MYPGIDAPVFVKTPQQPFFGAMEAAKLFTFRRAESTWTLIPRSALLKSGG
jgi:hypothetical protein